MQGWIKLHRKLLDWEWYDDINTTRLFVHLLLIANHEDKNWRGIEIKRGQRLTSLDKLSKETGLSVSKIRTCLKKLKSTNEVTSKSHSQHTVFTIENYDSYQSNDKQDDKPMTYESQTNDKPLTTNKNDKKEKNDNKPKKIRPSDEADQGKVIEIWNSLGCERHRGITRKAANAIDKTYAHFCKGRSKENPPPDVTTWLSAYLANGFKNWMTDHHRKMDDGKWAADLEFAVRLDTYEKVKNTVTK